MGSIWQSATVNKSGAKQVRLLQDKTMLYLESYTVLCAVHRLYPNNLHIQCLVEIYEQCQRCQQHSLGLAAAWVHWKQRLPCTTMYSRGDSIWNGRGCSSEIWMKTLKLPKGQPKRGPTFCFYPKRDSCKSKLHESGKVYNFYTFLHVQP